MQENKTLIDKASQMCGGDAALARKMGISKTLVSLMRKGERTITPQVAAELADIAGEDAREAVIAAVIESSKGTRKEGAMREILGKALAAGAAAMLVISYSAGWNSSTAQAATMPNGDQKSNAVAHCIALAALHALLAAFDASWRRVPIRRRPGQRRKGFDNTYAYHHSNFA